MADYSKDLYDYKYECRRNCSAYDDGYEQGATDMEKAKQIIINKLQEQIPKWHLVADGDLPKDEGKYLTISTIYFIPDHIDEVDNYIGYELKYFNSQYDMCVLEWESNVIAWMELPKF